LHIIPIEKKHIDSYWQAFDQIASERIFFGITRAFPMEETRVFVRNCIRKGIPFLVAVERDQVIGWCDIQPAEKHTGTLGIGVLKAYRGGGVGKRLMREALKAAGAYGYRSVQLNVRMSNLRAIHLYKQFGFISAGIRRNYLEIDGKVEDVLHMKLYLCAPDFED
jgi:ribosomal protein S18 acetylase RimI-like enzyme